MIVKLEYIFTLNEISSEYIAAVLLIKFIINSLISLNKWQFSVNACQRYYIAWSGKKKSKTTNRFSKANHCTLG